MMAAINSSYGRVAHCRQIPPEMNVNALSFGNSRLAGPPPLDLPPSDRLTVPFSKRKFTRHRTVACSASKRLPRVENPRRRGVSFHNGSGRDLM